MAVLVYHGIRTLVTRTIERALAKEELPKYQAVVIEESQFLINIEEEDESSEEEGDTEAVGARGAVNATSGRFFESPERPTCWRKG